ncbi:2OG-Fe dioxygenase family protein [Variovorax arabinosiphilus]|uniref:2OG-Fe dioxygenase family protein n=1 Tax=Variovorax arabinosiphilus TaxID=3053498 RepID=UPI002577ABE4|nr:MULTISPECIES: 2OG-Fe dioxygenase family protein [unclassified Variovorax]MDM0122695.1 2OG-Fe dioxygenase family protein [Variovorax sp. J2L1-78]MDM0132309.1 2OG-Fe dioxygenase family protein [Variovorax sp. J2L1-63]MDM0235458.1 2OG-Fe dioxygenase family protein [Variovorax sp. J2R1-6]
MSAAVFAPSFDPPSRLVDALRLQGYAVLSPEGVAEWLGVPLEALEALRADWDTLPPDEYLKDGGRYRLRRHSCFTVDGAALAPVPHRAHWQPVEYNALHGGMQRWFAPMNEGTLANAAWQRLLVRIADAATGLRGTQRWFVEAHQFRIDTTHGIGRPTPEGAHRDGVDLVAVMLVGRQGIKGGETRVFEADGRRGERFTLTEPWTLMLVDDARVIHESTPIQPLVEGQSGHRDTLVVTCRAGGFQGD